jgi:hypothetical protein
MSNNIGSSFSRFLSSSYMNRSELNEEEENGQKQENDDYERSRILNEFLDFDASRTTLANVPMPTPPSPPAVQQPHRRSGKGSPNKNLIFLYINLNNNIGRKIYCLMQFLFLHFH